MSLKHWIKRIIKRVIQKPVQFIIKEAEKEKRKKAQTLFKSISKKGEDSVFYGETLFVSKPEKVEIGQNVHMEDHAFIQSEGGLVIGDNTHIGRNFVVQTVTHDNQSDALPYGENPVYGKVVIGKNVWIGMNVHLMPGTEISDGCIIEPGTVVSGIIPSLSIIGPGKWRLLKYRDKDHYDQLNRKKRYSGKNGKLYYDHSTVLIKHGDSVTNRRTHVSCIAFNGKSAVKKQWEDNAEAGKAFETEKTFYQEFAHYPWAPKLYETGDDYLIMEYFDNQYRLDQMDLNEKSPQERNRMLGEILKCLIAIYANKWAHCDIHSKNIFYTPEGIKIIDYESAQKVESLGDFFNSYDITGEGLTSPFRTGNMGVLAEKNKSLKKYFDITDKKDLIERFQNYLKEELYEISNTFFTRRDKHKMRHQLRTRNIYSTFDLKYVQVDRKMGQRDIKKRMMELGVRKKHISGKNVLDVGSNIGSVLFELMNYKPQKALGLEYDSDKVNISTLLRDLHFPDHDITFKTCDVESTEFKTNFNETFHTVFCLAVIEHLENKKGFIQKLSSLCSESLFFEGNSGTDINFIKEELSKNGFTMVEFIGYSGDEKDKRNNNRPLFRAVK